MVKNVISLPGVSNAREFGGYPSAGDRRIKEGVLIRSGALVNATPDAVRTLREKYKVQTVIDFRSRDTALRAPDKEIPGACNICLPVVEMEDYAAMAGKPDMISGFRGKSIDKKMLLEMAIEYGLLGPDIYLLFLLGER